MSQTRHDGVQKGGAVMFSIGDRVEHITSGLRGVVVRVYEDALLVEVGRGDYRRWPLEQWRRI